MDHKRHNLEVTRMGSYCTAFVPQSRPGGTTETSYSQFKQESSHAAQTSEVSKTSEVLIAARPRYGTPRVICPLAQR